MTLSVWRYAHLSLAILSFLFLIVASVTGVILAVDAVNEKVPAYRVKDFKNINLAQSVTELRKVYPEIIEINIDHNQFVSIDATDKDGNEVKAYIDPKTGKVLGDIKPKSQFIQWNIALHRSLFLKETGRFIVGVFTFLLLLITVSGTILIIKRQQGIRHFFAKINKDFLAQYYHVVTGRLLLIPILIISLTGTYLFMIRFDLVKKSETALTEYEHQEDAAKKEISDFPIFKDTYLTDVEKVEFPFIPDDPDEFFVLKLKDREITVNQFSGEIIKESKYPYTAILEKLSLDLHTGRTNAIWAIILGIASLNILFFIYSGFVITFKRTRTKIKNKYNATEAEIILLFGTENGSTLAFANRIHKQLLADGKKSFIAEMNQYQPYPQAKQLIIFTSTYGIGTAPTNATRFEQLILEKPQQQQIEYSVVGFGSTSYPDFCAYAEQVDELLKKQEWTKQYLKLYTVNDKSTADFVNWVHAWSEKSLIALATAPALYSEKVAGLKKLKVTGRTEISEHNSTFTVLLKPAAGVKYQSGDLLAVYPANDGRERFYSIGKSKKAIRLVVKLYPNGFGSGYLNQLQVNSVIKARIISNADFHFPAKAPSVAMIANGTGIAPFLGMIENNKRRKNVHLYCGFRYANELTVRYQAFADKQIEKGHLTDFQIAFSREKNQCYVMDLIRHDANLFVDLLKNGGVIMICGSLAMQRDVEQVIEKLCIGKNGHALSYYKERKQILSDCY